jgi:LysR family transcriptional regulator, carnitine catabolism transcriptional activator
MLIRAHRESVTSRVSTRWKALSGQRLVTLTPDYPHQQLIDKQLKKSRIAHQRSHTVTLLETQLGLVEAGEGLGIIPSFGLLACQTRKVIISELSDPVVTFDLHELTSRAKKQSADSQAFSSSLKRHIATWAGESGLP